MKKQKKEKKGKIPTGIKIVSVLYYIGAVFTVLLGVLWIIRSIFFHSNAVIWLLKFFGSASFIIGVWL